MSARNLPVNSQLNTLTRREVRPPAFKTKSASSLELIPSPSLPVRIAVIGNHLPRQCGIATFTTDLCDAIASEHWAVGVLVAAINDSQSEYAYPARVRVRDRARLAFGMWLVIRSCGRRRAASSSR